MHFKKYKTILSPKNGMNIYRGCDHGCIYCDSRSDCYQMDHLFEDIEIKEDAPYILESQLWKKRNKTMISTGAMSDPYNSIESKVGYTRECLAVIEKHRFGLAIQTKSALILRDLDLLTSINKNAKCVVQTTLTTYDENLCRIIEPNVSSAKERFETLKIISESGIPVVVWLSPFLPYINDSKENIQGLLHYCIAAKAVGVICYGIGLTLREGNREYFYQKLEQHFPGLKEKYSQEFGPAYVCNSKHNDQLMHLLIETCKKQNIGYKTRDVFSYMRLFEDRNRAIQLKLFP